MDITVEYAGTQRTLEVGADETVGDLLNNADVRSVIGFPAGATAVVNGQPCGSDKGFSNGDRVAIRNPAATKAHRRS